MVAHAISLTRAPGETMYDGDVDAALALGTSWACGPAMAVKRDRTGVLFGDAGQLCPNATDRVVTLLGVVVGVVRDCGRR